MSYVNRVAHLHDLDLTARIFSRGPITRETATHKWVPYTDQTCVLSLKPLGRIVGFLLL